MTGWTWVVYFSILSRFWRDGGVFAELLVRSCERRRRAVGPGRLEPPRGAV